MSGHALNRTLHEIAWYPEHDPRKASAEYHRTHEHLVVTLDTPCWICGITHSQGGKMETHHSELELAAENALAANDAALAKLFADLIGKTPQEHLCSVVSDVQAIVHGEDAAALQRFIDSEGNMLVLCALHHRGAYAGIHSVTYPVWKLQRYQYGVGADAFQFVRAA